MAKIWLISLFCFSILIQLNASTSVSCPLDCGSGYCCETSPGSFGCCPYEKRISKETESSFENIYKLAIVVCPDRLSSCPDGSTCCAQSNSTWGCCQFQNAVCCSDGEHCCPKGTKCNVKLQACESVSSDNAAPSLFLQTIIGLPSLRPARLSADVNEKSYTGLSNRGILCGDKQSECPTDTTCCHSGNSEWACCPMPEAVCCADGQHCCPAGYQCDVDAGNCVKTASASSHQSIAKLQSTTASDIACPNEKFRCPFNTTCCELESKDWACCPMPNAVCCADQLHCCPKGMQCDIKHGACVKQSDSPPSRVCSGDQVSCPGGTCCQDAFGMQSCCPHVDAVCCGDGLHCCPKGAECEHATGKCIFGSPNSIPWFSKLHANRRGHQEKVYKPAGSVQCGDSGLGCSQNSTCCPLTDGSWQCCPMPNAICCSDGQHCCPEGTECSIEAQGCVPKLTPASNSRMSFVPETVRNDSVCPDGKSVCPNSSTCCQMIDNTWGCCPLPKGVCCADRLHCCPEHSKCNVSSGECIRKLPSSLNQAASARTFAASPMNTVAAHMHPHRQFAASGAYRDGMLSASWCGEACGPEQSCCPNSDGEPQSMCCSFTAGVCCPGGNFCCPRGSRCSTNDQCEWLALDVERTLGPYLIPATSPDGSHVARLLHPVPRIGHRIQLAKADPLLLYAGYRRLKLSRRTVCPNRMWYCPLDMQCCSLPRGRYACLAKTETC